MSTAALMTGRLGNSRSPSSIPWYIWVGVLAITSSSIGGAWHVFWYSSIGLCYNLHFCVQGDLYACGVLAGVICACLIALEHVWPRRRTAGLLGQCVWISACR